MKRVEQMGKRGRGNEPATPAPHLKKMSPLAKRITREKKVERIKELLNGDWDQTSS